MKKKIVETWKKLRKITEKMKKIVVEGVNKSQKESKKK